MTGADLVALLPLLVLVAGTLATLVVVSVGSGHGRAAMATGATLVLALASLPLAAWDTPRSVTPLLVVDGLSLLFLGLVLGASLAVVLLAGRYLEGRDERPEEFDVLLLLATVGGGVLACSRHAATLFLGIETLSVGLYGLIAYPRRRRRPLEAGLKYLLLGGASSAFLLLGVALAYAATGRLDFAGWGTPLPSTAEALPLVTGGLALVVAGLAFKLALVPFHMWTGDVYAGAPAPASAFVASVSKAAVAAVLLRLSLAIDAPARLASALILLAVASILGGNLLALRQQDLKRLLAYSSVAHLGYLLVALDVPGPLAAEAVTFYVAAYVPTILVAFGVVSVLSSPPEDAQDLETYRGLLWRRPWLGGSLVVSLLSLAGIPLTAGFIGKLYVVAAGISGSRWVLLTALVVGSVLGLYYYLRVIVVLLGTAEARALPRASLAASVALVVLVGLLVGLGAVPAPLQGAIHAALQARAEPGPRGRGDHVRDGHEPQARPVRSDHDETAQPVLPHAASRLLHVRVGLHGDRGASHHLAHAAVAPIPSPGHEAHDDVAVGDDPHRPVGGLPLDHGQGGGVVGHHQLGHVPNARIRCAADGELGHDVTDLHASSSRTLAAP
jgi:NADH-quinone oxidoreductase subunit N